MRNNNNEFRVGVVSFTDPRTTAAAEPRERYIAQKHAELVDFLQKQGFNVVNPMPQFRPTWTHTYGLNQTREAFECAHWLTAQKIDCLVFGCWHWSDSYLLVHTAARANVPIALYCEDDPAWAGSVFVTAVSASLRETVPNRHALVHQRFRGDKEELARWVRGVCGLQKLRQSAAMLWGGTYSLRMEHLQDDVPKLKSFLIGDILMEDQLALTLRAEKLLQNGKDRIEKMLNWLQGNGCKITYDEKMLTPESLRRQLALYLAARDRLEELAGEGIEGVSIKCQPEVSEEWATTACMLPAFLPFACDSEGDRPIISTVCEGDIKGLLSCMLLSNISADTPPLFGDVRYIGSDYWLLSNCGASSIFYSALSLEPKSCLPRITIAGQCQGASGGAVGYFTSPCPLTLARLTRVAGRYALQLALGEAVEVSPQIQAKLMYGEMWPLTVIKMPSDLALFFQVVGANHYSAIPGDYTHEVEYACKEAGIPVVRVDSSEEMRLTLRELG